jgi:hypothetical protein
MYDHDNSFDAENFIKHKKFSLTFRNVRLFLSLFFDEILLCLENIKNSFAICFYKDDENDNQNTEIRTDPLEWRNRIYSLEDHLLQ